MYKISGKIRNVEVWEEPIFPGDSGSKHYRITFAGHQMTVRPWWENCGATGEEIECSCGFRSVAQWNTGCWQHGHDKRRNHEFDDIHGTMYNSM